MDERQRQRTEDLLRALDEYNAAEDAADVASGCYAVEEAGDEIHARTDDLFEQMIELKPSTLDGYRAMACSLIKYCWSGDIRNGSTSDERMIAAMLSSLTGIRIETDA